MVTREEEIWRRNRRKIFREEKYLVSGGEEKRRKIFGKGIYLVSRGEHPAFKREDRLRKEPFAGFGTVVEDIT